MYNLDLYLVQEGQDVNQTLNANMDTVLHLVASEGTQSEIERGAEEMTALPFVLSLNPDLEAYNAAQYTPLMEVRLALLTRITITDE